MSQMIWSAFPNGHLRITHMVNYYFYYKTSPQISSHRVQQSLVIVLCDGIFYLDMD